VYFSIFNTHFPKTPCRPTIAGAYASLTKEQLTVYRHWALAIFIPLLQVSEKYIRKHQNRIQPAENSGLSRSHKCSRKQN